jgi:hypothetical protein
VLEEGLKGFHAGSIQLKKSMQDSYFEFTDEQVLGEGPWPAFLESWSLQLRNDTKMSPQLEFFFL